jgi:AcrR family transcriptional regulator
MIAMELVMQDMRVKVGPIDRQVREYEHPADPIIFLQFSGANLIMRQKAVTFFPLTTPFIHHIISNNKPTVGLLKSIKMARIVNKEEYMIRRNEILDAAQRVVYTKGYEQLSIQDILVEMKISKGAFYHYFDSKQALLEALIERLVKQILLVMTPIIQEEGLPASVKLLRIFDAASRWKTDRKETLMTLVNVWYGDDNVLLRQKVQTAIMPQIQPHLTTIIDQGVREGVFHTDYPQQASGIIFSLLLFFGDNMMSFISHPKLHQEALQNLENISASYQDAVERILGARPGSLPLFDTAILREWFPLSTNNSKE